MCALCTILTLIMEYGLMAGSQAVPSKSTSFSYTSLSCSLCYTVSFSWEGCRSMVMRKKLFPSWSSRHDLTVQMCTL